MSIGIGQKSLEERVEDLEKAVFADSAEATTTEVVAAPISEVIAPTATPTEAIPAAIEPSTEVSAETTSTEPAAPEETTSNA